ncbi:MAG: DUF4282 domain-containing protein [Actinobacteria bacterium]|nr:DUF4282 domain-containing protein [Actinomycetota bacterium]
MQPSSAAEAKGLFASLYDFNFTSFIATKIIRFVYALLVIVYSIGAVVAFIVGLASGKPASILFSLIFIPILYLVYLIMTRIWMEILLVVFRMGEDIRHMRMTSGGFGPTGPPAP